VTVKTGKPETSSAGGVASAIPILIGSFFEWLPTLGESWQVPQVPTIVFAPSGSLANKLSPFTPLIVIGFVLNSISPRATDARPALMPFGWMFAHES